LRSGATTRIEEEAMNPLPIVLGLTICEKIIMEEGTKNLTIVSTFTKIHVGEFPSLPQRFAVYCVLTEGRGDARIDLVLTSLASSEEIYRRWMPFHFPNPLAEARVLFRITDCVFPEAGIYQVTLLIDGEWVAQRRFHVVE
jgi:hypothetical protein